MSKLGTRVQREVEDSLAERILCGELKPGQIVDVDCEGDGLLVR